jgi:hypothetical protein
MMLRLEIGCGDDIRLSVIHARSLAALLDVSIVMRVRGQDLNVDKYHKDIDALLARHFQYAEEKKSEMSNTLSNVQIAIPDGDYPGVQSGYDVEFSTPAGSFKATAKIGIRGTGPCVVNAKSGELVVSHEPQQKRSDWLS